VGRRRKPRWSAWPPSPRDRMPTSPGADATQKVSWSHHPCFPLPAPPRGGGGGGGRCTGGGGCAGGGVPRRRRRPAGGSRAVEASPGR
jgi:hypothetical protein